MPQFVGFVIYLLASTAEVSRIPFDLPEAEGELVAGYHTEYGGMRWAMFQNAEYIALIAFSALASILFLGGYDGPVLPGPLWMLIKMFVFLFLSIWVRSTLPRVRYDRLMTIGWKVLLPLATVNLAGHLRDRGLPSMSPVTDNLKGFSVTFRHLFRKPVTQQFPDYKRPVYPRFRGRPPPAPARERPREVRRMLALRRGLPGRLHPRGGRREHARGALLGRRALRAHLRDQHEPLHLLRLLRAGLPVRRDHARPRLRAGRDVARRAGLHQADAAGARPEARRTPVAPVDPYDIPAQEDGAA